MAGSVPQFYVEDDSPEIAYYPITNLEPSPNVTVGWQLLYTSSGAADAPGEVGVGTSYHYTNLNDASFMIEWNGTGIDLMGTATDASYQLTLDGFPTISYSSDPAHTILASFNDLDNTNHTLLLTTIITNASSPNSFVIFDKALITYAPPAGTNNTTATTQTINDSDDIAFMGQWSYIADSTGSSMHVSGSAGSAITIYGLISSNSGNYTVTLDNVTTSLSAQSSYSDSDTLLFYATNLSQDMIHQVIVTNQENRTFALRAGGMNFTTFGNVTAAPTTLSTSSSTPKGTIAALVLAAVLGLLIFGVALYYFFVVRRRSRPVKKQASLQRSETSRDEKLDPDVERVIDISPPPGEEDVEIMSLSTSKGYGFGLGLRRGFPFAYRKSGKSGSGSSGRSRNGSGTRPESHPMTFQYGYDDKRFSINTLTADLPVLAHVPESEKLAPGWTNPVARTSFASKSGHGRIGSHGFLLPELRVEEVGAEDDDADDEDEDAKTLTSRQDEALAATLSLSPRTSEAPPGFGAAMRSVLGLDAHDDPRQPRPSQRDSQFLQVRETSPFRVDVGAILGNRDSRRTSGSGGSTWSKVRARLYRRAHRDDGRHSYHTDRQETSSSSGPESVPVVMLESGSGAPPSETAPASGTYSFLDFTSSHASHASLRRQSKATTLSSTPADVGHGRDRDASAWSDNTSVRMVRVERSMDDMASAPKPDAPSTVSRGSHTETPSDNSNGYSYPSAPTTHTHGSSPFPFPITITPSIHIPHPFNDVPERHTSPSPPPSPQLSSPQPTQQLQVPHPSPHETFGSPANSPTESVPFSVSDIHFRHSFSDYAEIDSRRTSAASGLPPHPPLPHRDGSQQSTPTFTPPPPYIVQRVLGLSMTPLSPPTPAARLAAPLTPASTSSTIRVSSARRPGTAPTITSNPSSPFRIGSLLGPRPRPSTAESTRGGTAAPQLPMQGGRASLSSVRGPR
ncbi:hypothetical protein HYDPIDRAFT_25534 [Hydnomerulius pinastri MD-312]|nr:hypothetical protein HYDPIDRAFT_25534 [Hydnomerulius pinastri MD-312]